MRSRMIHSGQNGTVILVALLALALCVVAITPLLWPFQAQTHILDTQRQMQQQMHIAHGGLSWAKAILLFDAQHSNIDTLQEPWAQGLLPTKLQDLPNTEISGSITDASAKFNLSNLSSDNPQFSRWLNAFERLGQSVGASEAEIHQIMTWLNFPTPLKTTNGSTSNITLNLNKLPPWVSPSGDQNAKLLQWNDFKDQSGLSLKTWQGLSREVIVLPKLSRVNANTVSALGLYALCPELTLQDAQALVLRRNQVPFRHLADFLGALGPKGCASSDLFDVQSDYFLVTGNIAHNAINKQTQALLSRQNGKVVTLWVQ